MPPTTILRWLKPLVYHPVAQGTFWYYWLQRYLCEVPESAGLQTTWGEAIRPFFAPGDGTPEGTRRSCEMIYRAWPRVEETCGHDSVVKDVRREFLDEFTRIRSGSRDSKWKETGAAGFSPSESADELVSSFVSIPEGCFAMGAPEHRQGMTKSERKRIQSFIQSFETAESLADDILSRIPNVTRTDRARRDSYRRFWMRVHREGIDYYESAYFPMDETPARDSQVCEFRPFQMSRYPVLNRWYRLFDPGHGVSSSPYAAKFAEISPDDDTPAIYLDWYMSWCFALWCHFDELSCRLPEEDEWEYAARGQTGTMDANGKPVPDDYQDYWWSDTFGDGDRCTSHSQRTTKPADHTKTAAGELGHADHENPFGLVDMLGNVQEWTNTRYRHEFSVAPDAAIGSLSRVCRGGSWVSDNPSFLRSARRSVSYDPTYSYSNLGCRLVRFARARKS